MTALSLASETPQILESGIPVARTTLVSWVKNAKETITQHLDAKEIIDSIREDKHFKLREPIKCIREKFWSVMSSTNNDRKCAKGAIDALKQRLPAAMWSGTFRVRRGGELLEHSGLLCADLDALGDQITDVRTKLVSSSHLWALFISPTGDGLKCVFRVSPDAACQKDSFRAVEDHVRTLSGIQIDESCSDVGRLCFLSHDPNAYLSENAIELSPVIKLATPAAAVPAAVFEGRGERYRGIAVELLGDIRWSTETRGLCACPGQHLHTTADGARDCQVNVDGLATLHCFHCHCQGIREGVTRELRSRIDRAKLATTLGTQNGSTTATVTPAEWFNQKFPLLYDQFGHAILQQRNNEGVLVAKNIGEDFFAATLGKDATPDAPTIFLQTEDKFYTYLPTEGIFGHQRDPVLLARLSRLLLDCGRACQETCDTQSLQFRFRDSQKLNGVLKKARGLLAEPHDFFSTELTEFIPCANGMLRLSDKEALPFSPTYRRRNKLAVAYDCQAKCPLFLDTLMRQALEPDDLDLVQRWCGLALIGENLAQRIAILTGTPGGGKGTFIRVLNGIIGSTNIASLRTQHLADRFEVGRFLGKTLVYGADVPENFLNQHGASVLKSLTGYDPVTLEFKNSNEAPLIICRFNVIVTCNSRLTVHLEGDMEAWRRRLAIVDYHKTKPREIIADLDRKILETEASGVLNWMIEGLDKIRADGWQLLLSSGQQAAVDNLLLESDGHNIFAREAIVRFDGEQLTVQDCFAGYVRFCSERGWVTLARNKFTLLIGDVVARTYGVTVRHDIKDDGGKSQRGWKGLQLSDKTVPSFDGTEASEPF